MNLRRTATIYALDMREAIRDGRILIAILLPVGLAVFYALTLPDPLAKVPATLHVAGDSKAELVEQVGEKVSESVDLSVEPARSVAQVRDDVEADIGAVGVVIASTEDGRAGDDVVVIRNDTPTTGAAIIEGAIREAVALGGSRDSVPSVEVDIVRASEGSPFERLDFELVLGVFSMVMLSLFIALLAVPVLLMEEVTRRTLEALQLVASTAEIIVAKLLVGLTYCAVAVAITIVAAGYTIDSPVGFVAAALAISLALSGFGLAFGLLLGDPGRVNTWAGIVMLPLFAPVFLALAEPSRVRTVAELFPTGAGTQLLAGAADTSAIDLGLQPYLVLAAWTIMGLVLLARLLVRREA